jgi:hypothetical protein
MESANPPRCFFCGDAKAGNAAGFASYHRGDVATVNHHTEHFCSRCMELGVRAFRRSIALGCFVLGLLGTGIVVAVVHLVIYPLSLPWLAASLFGPALIAPLTQLGSGTDVSTVAAHLARQSNSTSADRDTTIVFCSTEEGVSRAASAGDGGDGGET